MLVMVWQGEGRRTGEEEEEGIACSLSYTVFVSSSLLLSLCLSDQHSVNDTNVLLVHGGRKAGLCRLWRK